MTGANDVVPAGIDERRFWQAIGQRAIGVAVVTAATENGPAGFLALSATHVSANPPRTLVSIDNRTSALPVIQSARHFAINYLAHDDVKLADQFAGRTGVKGSDRFKEGQWRVLRTGAPILTRAVGALDCILEETIEKDRTLLALGRLVDFTADPSLEPLIHFRGQYRSFSAYPT